MSYESIVLADSPYAYWRLDDTAGATAADTSGNGRTGGYVGSPTLSASPLIYSDAGTAVDFNNTTQWVLSNFSLNTSQVTLEVWFDWNGSLPSPTQHFHVCGFADGESSGTHDKNIGINENGKAVFYAFSGGGKFATGATTLTAGRYFLAGVYDGTRIRIYVNGIEDGSTVCGATYTGYVGNNILVAGRPASTGVFPVRIAGRRDEFALWNTGLAADKILAHYAAGRAGFTNTAQPTLTGALSVGGTLTVSNGTWTPTPGSYSYYWHRADDTSGANLVEIGATGATYTMAAADTGKYIRAGVIPH